MKNRYWILSFLFASLFTFHSGYAGDNHFEVEEKNRIRVEDSSEFLLPSAMRRFSQAETYLKNGKRHLAWRTYLDIAQKMPNLLIPMDRRQNFESARLLAWKKMKGLLEITGGKEPDTIEEPPLAEPADYIFDRLFEAARQDKEISFDERFFIFETIAPYLPTKKGGFWHEQLSDALFEQGDFFSAFCLLGMVREFSIYYGKSSFRRDKPSGRIDRKMEMIKNIAENEMKFMPAVHIKNGREEEGAQLNGGRDYLIIEFSDKSVIERKFFDSYTFFPDLHLFTMSRDYGFQIFGSESSWVLDINGNFLERWGILEGIVTQFRLKDILFPKEGFIYIPKGIFQMGSPESETMRDSLNEALHTVTLTKDFEMQRTEVTQLQWYALMGKAPSHFRGGNYCKSYDAKLEICPDHPVESVSWEDSKKFIERLNQIQNEYDYRLPTEAEWEYAARLSGVPEEETNNLLIPDGFLDLRGNHWAKSVFGFGNDTNLLKEYAWYRENSYSQTHPVLNSRKPIGGIYGMHGNVWEWVEDLYDKNYGLTPDELKNGELKNGVKDPVNNHTGWNRVFRGGSWNHYPNLLRSAERNNGGPNYRYDFVGFRLVRTPRESER